MRKVRKLDIMVKATPANRPTQADLAAICRLLRYAARCENVSLPAAVTLLFCDDGQIRRYNRRYRQIDAATDVLSFPLRRNGQPTFANLPGLPPPPLGDIIISLPRSQAQAAAYGHSLRRELCFLALHGFLHLLGYDHASEEERLIMEERARGLLASQGVER